MIDPKDFKAHISQMADEVIQRAVDQFGREIPSLKHDLGRIRSEAALRAHLLVKEIDEDTQVDSFDHQILGDMALQLLTMAEDQHAKAGKFHAGRDHIQCIYHCRYYQVLQDIRHLIRPMKKDSGYVEQAS